jgi:pimeloyl-ACP methyl ester carboxylesterase
VYLSAFGSARTPSHFTTPVPLNPGDTLVIGFLGGFDHWDDPHRGVRKVALNLRDRSIPGVYAETMENHKHHQATELILQAFKDRSFARVILYGQSLGGSAVIKTARELQDLHIPVMLTVQIDSVGLNDRTIPANVAAAANFCQREPFSIIGRNRIRAADPSKTAILANTQFHYPLGDHSVEPESWKRKALGGAHARMEADPAVWAKVEQLIIEAIEHK